MCGIAGFISKAPLGPEASSLGRNLLQGMLHRGPDGEGCFATQHVWLGMRRLSIIDPKGGAQPLYNEDRSVALVANGEIYNHVELRKDLTARGHAFRTGSDCETIAHLYEEHGESCVDHLRGMFAFALWDSSRQRLLIARDRMGEKPLYLHEKEGRLFFSSELRPLISSGITSFTIDPPSIDLHLHFGYVPEPRTMVKDITKLPAGCTMTIEVSGWRRARKHYWRMTDAPPLLGNPVELVQEQLHQVGSLIIRSDVPVGVALSGGLDSSLVAALAARYSPTQLQAFTVGYEGPVESDEREDAQRFAAHLGMPWHEVVLSTSEVVDGFRSLVDRTDDPIGDIAGYGYYAVMRAARERGVPVMLQGQGGDELFWGYPWVKESATRSHLKALAKAWGWNALPDYWRAEFPSTLTVREVRRWLKKMCGLSPAISKIKMDLSTPREELVFYNLSNEFTAADSLARQVYSRPYLNSLPTRHANACFTGGNYWGDIDSSLTKLICDTYLIENGLAQGDRLSMASSVELRLPLVDYRLVETVLGLRKSRPDHTDPPKDLLRKVAADILPDWVMHRKKRGFSPPVDQWMTGIHKNHGGDLSDGILAGGGFLDKEAVARMEKAPPGRGPARNVWYSLVVLESWCRSMRTLSNNTA